MCSLHLLRPYRQYQRFSTNLLTGRRRVDEGLLESNGVMAAVGDALKRGRNKIGLGLIFAKKGTKSSFKIQSKMYIALSRLPLHAKMESFYRLNSGLYFPLQILRKSWLGVVGSAVRVITWQQDHFNGRMEMTIDSLNSPSMIYTSQTNFTAKLMEV